MPIQYYKCNSLLQMQFIITNNSHLKLIFAVYYECKDWPTKIDNGVWEGTKYRVTCACQPGFQMVNGDGILTCSSLRRWYGAPTICVRSESARFLFVPLRAGLP